MTPGNSTQREKEEDLHMAGKAEIVEAISKQSGAVEEGRDVCLRGVRRLDQRQPEEGRARRRPGPRDLQRRRSEGPRRHQPADEGEDQDRRVEGREVQGRQGSQDPPQQEEEVASLTTDARGCAAPRRGGAASAAPRASPGAFRLSGVAGRRPVSSRGLDPAARHDPDPLRPSRQRRAHRGLHRRLRRPAPFGRAEARRS